MYTVFNSSTRSPFVRTPSSSRRFLVNHQHLNALDSSVSYFNPKPEVSMPKTPSTLQSLPPAGRSPPMTGGPSAPTCPRRPPRSSPSGRPKLLRQQRAKDLGFRVWGLGFRGKGWLRGLGLRSFEFRDSGYVSFSMAGPTDPALS